MRTNSLIILALLFVFGASAQRELTASEAVFIALENNYQILVANKQHEINHMNNKWSQAGLFPTVDLVVAQQNAIQDNRNNPLSFTPGSVILSQGLNPSVNMNWNLFTGLAVKMSKQQLEQLEQQSGMNAMAIIETTIQDVLKAYYTAKLQEERTQLFKDILNASQERFAYYELKEKHASSNSLELLQFKNQLLTDSSNYLLQKISYDNAIRNLQLLMNEDKESQEEIRLTDDMSADIELIDLDKAEEDMLANNANLKNQYLALELQKTNTSLQKSFLYPTLSFQAGVQPGWQWLRDLNNDSQQFSTQNLSYYGNFNLRYTLFNNWKNKRAVDAAKIQEEIAQLNIESMEQTLKATMFNLIQLYDARVQLLNISEENLVYAKKAYDLAVRRFENGSINSVDLMSFRNNYQTTLVTHYENLFNRMDTYLEIYKMTGKISLNYQKETP